MRKTSTTCLNCSLTRTFILAVIRTIEVMQRMIKSIGAIIKKVAAAVSVVDVPWKNSRNTDDTGALPAYSKKRLFELPIGLAVKTLLNWQGKNKVESMPFANHWHSRDLLLKLAMFQMHCQSQFQLMKVALKLATWWNNRSWPLIANMDYRIILPTAATHFDEWMSEMPEEKKPLKIDTANCRHISCVFVIPLNVH